MQLDIFGNEAPAPAVKTAPRARRPRDNGQLALLARDAAVAAAAKPADERFAGVIVRDLTDAGIDDALFAA